MASAWGFRPVEARHPIRSQGQVSIWLRSPSGRGFAEVLVSGGALQEGAATPREAGPGPVACNPLKPAIPSGPAWFAGRPAALACLARLSAWNPGYRGDISGDRQR